MQGLHLTADALGCSPPQPALLQDADMLRNLALQACADAGLKAVGELFHRFAPPGGITGVVLLAESHLALHTWPELGAVTLDVYVCNSSGDHGPRAERLMAVLLHAFAPAVVQQQRVERGELLRATI